MTIAVNPNSLIEEPVSLLTLAWDGAGQLAPVESSDPALMGLKPDTLVGIRQNIASITNRSVVLMFLDETVQPDVPQVAA